MSRSLPCNLFFRSPVPKKPEAPLFVYLPGMDGTGLLFHRQAEVLKHQFDIRCLSIPLAHAGHWPDLAQQLIQLIHQERAAKSNPMIYLCGESFGGCLALQTIAQAPRLFDRILLINPASSFHQHPWLYWGSQLVQPLPQALHRMSCLSFLPFLAALERMTAADRQALLQVVQSVSQEASAHRLRLLREFSLSEDKLQQVSAPVVLVASQSDRLLPSVAEADRLQQQFPHSQRLILPDSGHACLLEKDVSLYTLMQAATILPSQPSDRLPRSTRSESPVPSSSVLHPAQ